jgi:hypothetical protein
MTTVIFIHGTGVRATKFAATLKQVKAGLGALRGDLRVEGCYWGEIGARLWAGGASLGIPPAGPPAEVEIEDRDAGDEGVGGDPVPEAELELARWAALLADPLFEIRLRQVGNPRREDQPRQTTASLFSPPPSPAARLTALADNPGVVATLAANGVTEERLRAALTWIAGSPEFATAFRQVTALSGASEQMLARAVVARCLQILEADGVEFSGQRRDDLVDAVGAGFGVPDYGLPDELGKLAKNIAFGPAGWALGKSRRSVIGKLADILLYQAQGAPLRRVVRERILELSDAGDPVVLLAHSLGGVIAFDLLASEDAAVLDRVRLLVTVGSQVPLLYELRALTCDVGYQDQLPAGFGQLTWLNVYDKHDLLGYPGAGLFDGRCRDITLDTGQPFPFAHSAYWDPRAGLYQRVADALRATGL